MAKMDYKLDIDFSKIDLKEPIETGLKDGANLIASAIRNNLDSLTMSKRSTGTLKKSLGITRIKDNFDSTGELTGYRISIGFAETRSDGETNAKLASIINYGSSKRNQPARPFWTTAIKSSEQQAYTLLTQSIEKGIEKIANT